MSFLNEATPSVTVKKRNLNSLVEYCIENKIDFTLRSANNDEFDVEFLKAIASGKGEVTMAFENALQFELGSSN